MFNSQIQINRKWDNQGANVFVEMTYKYECVPNEKHFNFLQVDYTIHQLYNALTERQKRFAKYAEQIQKVQEMHNVLNKVKMNVEQTLPLMERLNSVLPPNDQLEPFSMKPQSSTW